MLREALGRDPEDRGEGLPPARDSSEGIRKRLQKDDGMTDDASNGRYVLNRWKVTPFRRLLFFVGGDVAIVTAAVILAFALRFDGFVPPSLYSSIPLVAGTMGLAPSSVYGGFTYIGSVGASSVCGTSPV
jgi:hypothetical protein